MGLFDEARQHELQKLAPLATRLRPQSVDEFVGQESLMGPDAWFRRALVEDRLPSCILYGPPGSGKTTLAQLSAELTSAHFVPISAVTATVAELRSCFEEARRRLGEQGQRTIVFIDELHRLNKGQQDVLLPVVEQGLITMLGATTENPYFSVARALLSRAPVLTLEPLSDDHLRLVLERALTDQERGYGRHGLRLSPAAEKALIQLSQGDARVALNTLEQCARLLPEGERQIAEHTVRQVLSAPVWSQDRAGDQHYDMISALIKSIRGSDPDAALFWFVRMIEGGEDPRFIVRRLLIHSAEDVGLADPLALVVTQAAAYALEWIGLPEASIPISEAILYLSTAPKSNSVVAALARVREAVQHGSAAQVPKHLKNKGADGLSPGHNPDYRYPHDAPNHYVEQTYLPAGVRGLPFYQPSDSGAEAARAAAWRRITRRLTDPPAESDH